MTHDQDILLHHLNNVIGDLDGLSKLARDIKNNILTEDFGVAKTMGDHYSFLMTFEKFMADVGEFNEAVPHVTGKVYG